MNEAPGALCLEQSLLSQHVKYFGRGRGRTRPCSSSLGPIVGVYGRRPTKVASRGMLLDPQTRDRVGVGGTPCRRETCGERYDGEKERNGNHHH